MKNYGFLPELEKAHRSEKDWIFGAKDEVLSGIAEGINFEEYFPKGEVQRGIEDFMDCATRGPMNILETKLTYAIKKNIFSPETIQWLRNKGYCDEFGNVELSDRFNAILSNTTRSGNSMKAPIESIRVDGIIPKSMLPKEDNMTWDMYHDKTKITQAMRDLGQEFKTKVLINYQIVDQTFFKDVQKYDMINVALFAWPNPINGVYQRVEYTLNHVVAKFKDFYHYIFDNYIEGPDDFIKQLAPDYNMYGVGYRIIINEVPQPVKKNEAEEGENMTFYKNPDSPKVYQKGVDGLFHWLIDQPVFEGLYGSVSQANIQVINIPPEKIGFTIYDKRSILSIVMDFFTNKLSGK